jgi:4-hydroxybutyrate dehydrogenase
MTEPKIVTWNFPTRILFGVDAVSAVGSEARALIAAATGEAHAVRPRRALIVTDPGVRATGVADVVGRALGEAEIGWEVFDGLTGNPTEAHVRAATEQFVAEGASLVVGLGGGSAIDVAKLVRLCATHPGPLEQYDDALNGSARITQPVAPMIAIPTTAGTGSEVGRSGVATLASTGRKTVFFAPRLIPSVAILDPRLTVSMPRGVTAATGFDALTHAIEAYCAPLDHPMADAIALEAIRLVAANLERATDDGGDLSSRGAMLKAAAMGAVAFQKGLGACHSLAHPLSSENHLHHGLANALCLPAVVDFNRSAVPAKLARIATLLGVRSDDAESLAFECAGALRALRRRLDLPEGLLAAGVREDQLERLADLAFADACHQDNPRRCTREDLLALYRASLS